MLAAFLDSEMTDLNFPLSMALQNYMPVLLSTLAFYWIAQMLRAKSSVLGNLAMTGVMLAFVGGMLKATWKLSMSLTHADVALFRDGLFPLIGPGFTLMAFAVGSRRVDKQAWLWPLLISGAAWVAAAAVAITVPGRMWVYVLMGLTTVANTVFMILLMRESKAQHQTLALILFVINLFGGFAMAGIGAMPNKTLETHWMEQILSTAQNAALAWGAWRLAHLHATAPSLTQPTLKTS